MLTWRPWIDALLAIQANTGKTVILTEIGTRSQAGSYQAPWIWNDDSLVSEQDHARYFDAFCQAATGMVVTTDQASLRAAPAVDAEPLAPLLAETTLTIVGPAEDAAGRRWYPVIDMLSGVYGWVESGDVTRGWLLHGIYIWVVNLSQDLDVPDDDRGFTPINKAAEPVISDCFAQELPTLGAA
jgi:hypothetical protein